MLQVGQGRARDEVVDVGQGGRHPPGEGLVAGRRLQRVDPHHLVGDPVQAGHRPRPATSGSPRSQPSERTTTTAPRAMPRTPQRSSNVPQAVAQPGAARPVGDVGAGAGQGLVGVTGGERPGDAGQPGAEGEGLDPTGARPATAAWAKRTRARA